MTESQTPKRASKPQDELAFLRDVPDLDVGLPPNLGDMPVVAASYAATRREQRARRTSAVVLSVVWMAMHLAVYGVRQDFDRLPVWYVIAQIGVPFLIAVASVFVALSPGKYGLGLGSLTLTVLALGLPAAFVVGPLSMPLHDALGSSESFLLDAVVCFDITLAWTAVPLLAAALSLRHAFPGGSGAWRAALVGAGCGLFSGATMNLHCPNSASLHVALGHGLPVVIATIVGGVILGRLTSR